MKNVVVLGSTGSIGTSTIKVAEDLPDRIRLLAHGLVVEIVGCRAQKPIEHQRHEDRRRDHHDHVQKNDP